MHGVRTAEELAYREEIESLARRPDLVSHFATDPRKLVYLPIATREALPGMPQERLTTLIADGRLEQLAGQALDPETTRVMLCGNPAMLADARKLLGERGFKTDAAAFPVIWPWKTIGDGKVPGDALVRKSSVWHCART